MANWYQSGRKPMCRPAARFLQILPMASIRLLEAEEDGRPEAGPLLPALAGKTNCGDINGSSGEPTGERQPPVAEVG
ncbi:MAG TPA: hypothetical protein VHP11_02260 [Tepidisphaeraceae bacterium]|nr:hypothetical protein [Tepidisphaeraceae bacterium]